MTIYHDRRERWGLLGIAWNQPNQTFGHREDWTPWCVYCQAKLKEAK